MTREEKINILSKAMAQEMMEYWDKVAIRGRLGPICDSAQVVVFEYAKLYWKDCCDKHTDEELDECWWGQADYKGEIDGVKNE